MLQLNCNAHASLNFSKRRILLDILILATGDGLVALNQQIKGKRCTMGWETIWVSPPARQTGDSVSCSVVCELLCFLSFQNIFALTDREVRTLRLCRNNCKIYNDIWAFYTLNCLCDEPHTKSR
jgi:hypothetical protein